MNRFQKKLNKRVRKTIFSAKRFYEYRENWDYKRYRNIIKYAMKNKKFKTFQIEP